MMGEKLLFLLLLLLLFLFLLLYFWISFPCGSQQFLFDNGGRFDAVGMILKLRADLSTMPCHPRSATAWRKCSSAAAASPGSPSMPFTSVGHMGGMQRPR